ncbi:MAG: BglII/BstYI family type II restriction endonuclease [Candidatus Limnocylindria bacterium]
MKIVDIYSHRNGRDILLSPDFVLAFNEFQNVLRGLPTFRAAKAKKTSPNHIVAPGAMNKWLDQELCVVRDWDWHPLIIDSDPANPSATSRLRSDFRKSRIEVEVQFGNVARYTYDVYKMAISLSLDKADVGLMVVCTKRFAEITGGNIAYFERAVRELHQSRLTLIVPLAVIAIEPDRWDASSFLPEASAPAVTAATINKARKERGQAEIPSDAADEPEPSLAVIRRLAERVA